MAQITGGKVSILKRVQKAQFEPQEVTVELTFSVSEGDGRDAAAILDVASDMAKGKVAELLNDRPVTGRSKADIEKEAIDKLNGGSSTPDAAPKKAGRPSNAAKAAAAEAAKTTETLDDVKDTTKAVDDDPFSAEAPAEEKITDEVFLSKISAHNGKVKNAPEIRRLVAKQFSDPAGKQAKDVPQEKRKAFLVDLEKIGPA